MLGSVSRILPRPIRIFHPPLKEATSCSPSSTVKPIMFMIRSAREDSVVTPFLSAAACSFVMRSNTCRDNVCVCVCVCVCYPGPPRLGLLFYFFVTVENRRLATHQHRDAA